jgi:hypothetical protein
MNTRFRDFSKSEPEKYDDDWNKSGLYGTFRFRDWNVSFHVGITRRQKALENLHKSPSNRHCICWHNPRLYLSRKKAVALSNQRRTKTAAALRPMKKFRLNVDKSGFTKSVDAEPVTICFVETGCPAQSAGLQKFRDQKLSFLRLILGSRALVAPNQLRKELVHNYEGQKH